MTSREEWSRAYEEINAFEHELYAGGIVLVKFWIHVTSAEQLRRFFHAQSAQVLRDSLAGFR